LRAQSVGQFSAIILALALLFLLTGPAAAEEDEDEDEGSGLSLDDILAGSTSGGDDSGGITSSFAQGHGDFEGNVQSKFAVDVQKDNDMEDLLDWRSLVYGRGYFKFNRNFYASVSGLFDYSLAYSDETSTEHEIRLYEGYMDIVSNWGQVRAGQQLVTWGRADLINPTSVINPPDLRKPLDLDLGYDNIPVLAVKGDLFRGPVRFESVYVPFFVPAKFKIIGSDWAALKHEFPLGDALDYLDEQINLPEWQELLDLLYPPWKDELQDFLNDETLITDNIDEPEDDFQNGEGGARLSLSFTRFDCSVMYAYTWDDVPTLYLNPELEKLLEYLKDPRNSGIDISKIDVSKLDPPLRGLYHRIHTIGADFSTTFKGVGFVVEGAATIGRRTYNLDLEPEQASYLQYVVQVDHLFSGEFYLGGSWIQAIQLDYHPDRLTEQYMNLLAVVLRKPWMDDKIETAFLGFADFTMLENEELEEGDFSSIGAILNPYVSFSLTEDLRLNVGATLLLGGEEAIEDYYKENSQAFVAVKYSF